MLGKRGKKQIKLLIEPDLEPASGLNQNWNKNWN
jgi:hypothetical protein